MKKFAADLCDSEDKESIEAGLSTYKELYPLLFEDENMTMNFDMLEMYIKQLAKKQDWQTLIDAKRRQIKYYSDTKTVDHRTRRSFLEIICAQVLLEDYYRLEDTLTEFCREVGGNPYSFDEYEICVGIKESIEKRDFEKLQAWSRKPLFGFIEVELVKPFKAWANNPPLEPLVVV